MRSVLLTLLLLAAPVYGEEPVLRSLEPSSGPVGSQVATIIHGDSLPADARVALLAGGPRRVAGLSLAGSSRAYGLDLDGDRAVVAFFESAPFKSGGFEVIDVSDPQHPVSIERYAVVDITGLGAVAAGDEVFSIDFNIYTFDGALRCVDLSQPGAPRQVAVQYFPEIPNKVSLAGNTVVVTHSSGVYLFDREHPQDRPLALETPGPAWQALMLGGRLYVTYGHGGGGGLQVWSDRGRGDLVADLELPLPAYGLAAEGELVVVTLAGSARGELRVFESTEQTPLSPLGALPLPGFATDLSLRGERALASMGAAGLAVIGLADPSAPSLLGSFSDLGFSAWEAELDDRGFAQVADFGLGLTVVDLRYPRPPLPLGAAATSSPARALDVEGRIAALALGAGGVEFFDLTQPEAPEKSSTVNVPGGAEDLRLRDGVAYVAAGRSGLTILDASDPANPGLLGTVDTPGTASGVALDGTMVLVADGSRGLSLIDAEDPRGPRLLTTLRTGGPVRAVSVRGSYAYLAAGYRGLQVVDLADPTTPQLVVSLRSCGSRPLSGARATALLGDDLLLVASSTQGVAAFRLDDPEAPECTGMLVTPGRAQDVVADDSRAFVADDRQGLAIIDYADSLRPQLIESLPLDGPATGVSFAGGLAALAAGDSGLVLVRPNPELRDVRWLDPGRIAMTVPSGMAPGPYDLRLLPGEGAAAWLRNAWLACPARAVPARLEVVEPPPGRLLLPLAWLPVSDEPIEAARLLLPELGQPLIERVSSPAGGERIEAFPPAAGRPARLRLSGPDPDALLATWAGWQRSGGIPFPVTADGAVSPQRLAVEPGIPANAAGAFDRRLPVPVTTVYRFELDGSRLRAATASGPGADLSVVIDARSDSGCPARAVESLSEAQAELCRDSAPTWLRGLCPGN